MDLTGAFIDKAFRSSSCWWPLTFSQPSSTFILETKTFLPLGNNGSCPPQPMTIITIINNPLHLFRALQFQMLFTPAVLFVLHASAGGRGLGVGGLGAGATLGCKEVRVLKVTLRIWAESEFRTQVFRALIWFSGVNGVNSTVMPPIPGAHVSDSGWSWVQ